MEMMVCSPGRKMAAASLAPLEFDPYAYQVHEDPYPVYARLRAEAPAYRNEALGFWALSRHADVLAGFRDWQHFSNRNGVSLDLDAFHENAETTMSFLAMDPPRHDRLRALVSRGFTPRRVSSLEPHIRALSVRYLDSFVEKGSCDFIRDFAGRLPMDVISEMLGVPAEDRPTLREWADLVVHREEGVRGLPPAAAQSALRMLHYFTELLADRRARPRDDLTGALIAAEIDGDRLSEREIVLTTATFVMAGVESLSSFMSMLALNLHDYPDARRRIVADPALMAAAIEESLRFNTSAQRFKRVVMRETELHGQRLKVGDKVVLAFGSGNRDWRKFPDPDVYDVERRPQGHLGFGSGTHFCLGSQMARLVTEVAMKRFLERVPNYHLTTPALAWNSSSNFRSPVALPFATR